ncbi:MAG: hypothetical protein WC570_03960 [Patescibacteria group bacterium]
MDILRKVFQKAKNKFEEKENSHNEETDLIQQSNGNMLPQINGYPLITEKDWKENILKPDEEVVIDDNLVTIDNFYCFNNTYEYFVEAFNGEKTSADFIKVLNDFKAEVDGDEQTIEKDFFNFTYNLIADTEDETEEAKEAVRAFIRIMADRITGDSDYEYYRKVQWMGPSNDSQWNVIGHVLGEENMFSIFNKESIFHKEKEKDLHKK